MKAYHISRIITGIIALGIAVWLFFSWREVMAHQSNPDIVYSAWNLFQILF